MRSSPIQIQDFSSKVNQLQEKQKIQIQISQSASNTPKAQLSVKFTQTNSANLTPTNIDDSSKRVSLKERAGLNLPQLHPLKQLQDQILKRRIKVHEVIEEEKVYSMTSVDKQVNQSSFNNFDKQTPLPDINFQPSRHMRQLYQQNIKHNNQQNTSPKSNYTGTPYLSPASPLFQPATPYLSPNISIHNSEILTPTVKLRQKATPIQSIQSPNMEETPDNCTTNKYSQKSIVDDTPKQQNISRVMKMMNNKLRLKTKDKENKFFNRYIKHYENCDTYFNVRQIFQSLNSSNKISINSPLSNTFDEQDLTPQERQALVTALEVEKKEREELMQKQNMYNDDDEENFDQDSDNNQNQEINSAHYSVNGQKSSFYQSKFGQRSKMLQEIISMKSSFQNEKSPSEKEEFQNDVNQFQEIKLSEQEIFFMDVLQYLKNTSLNENDRITDVDEREENQFYRNLYQKLMEQLTQEKQNQEVKNSLNHEQTIQIQRIQEHIRRIKEENEKKNQQNETSNKKRLEDEYTEFKKKSEQAIKLIRKGGYKIYRQKIKSLEEEEKKKKQIQETINNFKEFKEQLKFKPLHHGNFTNSIRDRVRSMPAQIEEIKFKKIESSPSQQVNMIKRLSYASLRTKSIRNDQTPQNQKIDNQSNILIKQNTNNSLNNVQQSQTNIQNSQIMNETQRIEQLNQDLYLTGLQNVEDETETNKNNENKPKREKQVSYSLDLKSSQTKQLELSRKQTIQIGSNRSEKSETSLKQVSQLNSSDQDIQNNGKVQMNNSHKDSKKLNKQSSFYNQNNSNNQGNQTSSNQQQGSPNNSIERKKYLSYKSAASNIDFKKDVKRNNSFNEQEQQNNIQSTPKTSNFQTIVQQNQSAYPKKAQNLMNQIFKNSNLSFSNQSIKSKEEFLQSTELSKNSLIDLSEIYFQKHDAFCTAIEAKNQQKLMNYRLMQQNYKKVSQSLDSSRQDDMQQSQQLQNKQQPEGEKQKYQNAYSQQTNFHSSKSPLLILKNQLRKVSAFQQKYSNKVQSLLYNLDFVQEENHQVKQQTMKTVSDSTKSYEQIMKDNYPELECLRELVEKSAIQNKIQKEKQYMKKIQI